MIILTIHSLVQGKVIIQLSNFIQQFIILSKTISHSVRFVTVTLKVLRRRPLLESIILGGGIALNLFDVLMLVFAFLVVMVNSGTSQYCTQQNDKFDQNHCQTSTQENHVVLTVPFVYWFFTSLKSFIIMLSQFFLY